MNEAASGTAWPDRQARKEMGTEDRRSSQHVRRPREAEEAKAKATAARGNSGWHRQPKKPIFDKGGKPTAAAKARAAVRRQFRGLPRSPMWNRRIGALARPEAMPRRGWREGRWHTARTKPSGKLHRDAGTSHLIEVR